MLKICLPYDPVIPLWTYTHTLYPTVEVIARPRSLLLQLQQSRRPLTEEWIMKSGSFIQWNIIQQLKKEFTGKWMKLETTIMGYVRHRETNIACFLSSVGDSFDSLDMCASFGISTEVKTGSQQQSCFPEKFTGNLASGASAGALSD